MSESMHEHQPVSYLDTAESAPEAHAIPTCLTSLVEHAQFVHPMFANRMDSEARHAERRYVFLQLATDYYIQGKFAAAVGELREIRHDFEISGDDTHFEAIDSAIDHCRECTAGRLGEAAIAQPLDQIA